MKNYTKKRKGPEGKERIALKEKQRKEKEKKF